MAVACLPVNLRSYHGLQGRHNTHTVVRAMCIRITGLNGGWHVPCRRPSGFQRHSQRYLSFTVACHCVIPDRRVPSSCGFEPSQGLKAQLSRDSSSPSECGQSQSPA